MRPFAFNNFLITGAYKNIYELKKEIRKHLKAVKPEISVEEAIKKHLKKYYKSRVTFDQTFEDGEKFKYGALNIGGHGLQKFGEYCVVINRDQSKRYVSLTFIKEESLHYIDGDHVDVQRLSQDVANRECVHFLAVSKHENDIKRIPADDWTFLVCCDNCYIEVVTTDNISNKHIESVRVNKKYYDFIKNLYYKDFISEISDSENFCFMILRTCRNS